MKTDWFCLYIIGLLALAFWLGFQIGLYAPNQSDIVLEYRHQTPQNAPQAVLAHQDDIDSNILDILWCESRFDHSRKNTSGAEGIAQFKPETFNWLKQKADMPNLNIKHASDQVILLSWALENGYGNYWECYYDEPKGTN